MSIISPCTNYKSKPNIILSLMKNNKTTKKNYTKTTKRIFSQNHKTQIFPKSQFSRKIYLPAKIDFPFKTIKNALSHQNMFSRKNYKHCKNNFFHKTVKRVIPSKPRNTFFHQDRNFLSKTVKIRFPLKP